MVSTRLRAFQCIRVKWQPHKHTKLAASRDVLLFFIQRKIHHTRYKHIKNSGKSYCLMLLSVATWFFISIDMFTYLNEYYGIVNCKFSFIVSTIYDSLSTLFNQKIHMETRQYATVCSLTHLFVHFAFLLSFVRVILFSSSIDLCPPMTERKNHVNKY